jgi:hypothetical protein
MNRKDLIRHLEAYGCLLWREGKKHTIYHNPATGQCTDLFFVAERRLRLGRRFNAGSSMGEIPSRGATVEGCEE